jgi:hypothetical protein
MREAKGRVIIGLEEWMSTFEYGLGGRALTARLDLWRPRS